GATPAVIHAKGTITLNSTVTNRPYLTSSASTQQAIPKEPKEGFIGPQNKVGPVDLGIALAIVFGDYRDHSESYIASNASVYAKKAITVNSQTLNAFDPLSLEGSSLVAPFLPNAFKTTYDTNSGTQILDGGNTAELKPGYSHGGSAGYIYSYI